MKKLAVQPALAQQRQTVTLGDALYDVRLTWRERLRGWYLDLYDADGALLVGERRVEPGWGPLWGLAIEGAPTVALVVIGPTPYRREDLGASLQILIVSADEIPQSADAGDGLTVEVAP
jgi:hypothetical protein